MHNMSDQFYKYIAESLFTFFSKNKIEHGDKFHLQLEKENQVRMLYESIKDLNGHANFTYYTDVASYETYALQVGNVKLIIAATIDGTSPDWLTHLRNKVVTNEGQFKDTAILFIHDTNLDSITGGAKGMQIEGMPLHVKNVISDIENILKLSILSKAEQAIIKVALKKKNKQVFEDNTSIFEYQDLLKAVFCKKINKDNYKDFGLFYDANLSEYDGEKLKKRLEDNAYFFEKVDDIHKYGVPENDLEKHFDPKGIKLLQQAEWKNVEYKYVKQSQENKNAIKPLEYVENDLKETDNGLFYWERAEGLTKAKSRIRNIIIFNPNSQDSIQLDFYFSNHLKKQFLDLKSIIDVDIVGIDIAGKKLKVHIQPKTGKANFVNIVYNYKEQKVKFVFKIVVLECNEKMLENVKTCYSIIPKEELIIINHEEQVLVINPAGDEEIEEEITSYDDYQFEIENHQQLIIQKKLQFIDEDKDYIKFKIKISNTEIPLAVQEVTDNPVVITGRGVWRYKRENKENFEYKGENKLVQGTKEYFAREDFRLNLKREEIIVKSKALFYQETSKGLEAIDLEIPSDIKIAYQNIVQYYEVHNLLPSLTYLNDELKQLFIEFLKVYIDNVESIPAGTSLVTRHKNLIKVGTIEKIDEERGILFTPLHPLNMAYQITLNEKIGQEILSKELLKTLNLVNLLPYIYHEHKRLYKPVEQRHSPEWNYYVYHKLSRYNGSRNYMAKLVKDKIEEFIGHFKYLFSLSNYSPLILDLINLGDCNEVLQGIFNFYIQEINKNPNVEQLTPIELYIYSKGEDTNAFEEISFYEDAKLIEDIYGLNLKSNYYSEADVLNIFREKVHFYLMDSQLQKINYAHITFYQMEDYVEESYAKMNDLYTGVSLEGLMSGVPSVYDGEAYKTGFGTKYLRENNNLLLKLAVQLNALALKSNTVNPYDPEECIVMAVSNCNKKLLDNIYDVSHWVTFIDPKVNLNFFKNDPNNSDLLILHYSDQYTSASGYDAITVTRKSKQYQLIIEEFLKDKGIKDVDKYSSNIINLFNSINGDWLLRLISGKGHFPREKLSILSAIKISLAYFYHPDIVWIPISMEEILRVSGGAGLKKGEGLFSAKNLGEKGPYSDDLLLVGIQEKEENVQVYYYPIEVKIGNNNSSVIKKAKLQVNKTRKLIEDHLSKKQDDLGAEDRFTRAMYRNFLIKLAVVYAEKIKLYGVWPEQLWDKVINGTVREKLFNDDYEISNEVDKYIGRGAVMSFKKDIHFKNQKKEDDVLILEFTEQDGYDNIIADIECLKEKYINGKTDFDTDQLLFRQYSQGLVENYTDDDSKPSIVNPTLPLITKGANLNSKEDKNVSTKPLEILFGSSIDSGQPISWFPTSTDKIMHTNTGIIGTMGTGKTQFTKSLVAQLYRNQADNVKGTPISILIFDYKGDYIKQDFVEATNAKILDLYHLPFNPLSLYLTDKPKNFLPLHTASTLVDTISTSFGLGVKQQTTLRGLIKAAYKKRGILKDSVDTWNRVAPTIDDVYRIYDSNEEIKKDDSLYSALNKLYEYEFFEPNPNETQTLFDIIQGVTVINLSGYEGGIQNLVVAITLDIFYNQMQLAGHSCIEGNYRELKKMILVDEADNFLSKDFKSLKKILKEGREFGVGTILSTQLLSHFSTADNEYANYILTWVVHNVSDITNKDVRYIFNTSSKSEEENILNRIKDLKKHCSIVSIGTGKKPVHIEDKAFWQLDK